MKKVNNYIDELKKDDIVADSYTYSKSEENCIVSFSADIKIVKKAEELVPISESKGVKTGND